MKYAFWLAISTLQAALSLPCGWKDQCTMSGLISVERQSLKQLIASCAIGTQQTITYSGAYAWHWY